ncbi:MAG: hypothetical protein ABI629_08340 [bacterium]
MNEPAAFALLDAALQADPLTVYAQLREAAPVHVAARRKGDPCASGALPRLRALLAEAA